MRREFGRGQRATAVLVADPSGGPAPHHFVLSTVRQQVRDRAQFKIAREGCYFLSPIVW